MQNIHRLLIKFNFTDLNTFGSNPVISIVKQLSLLEFLQFKSMHTWLL